MEKPLFLVIDLFCGAGGVTIGFDDAMYVAGDGKLYKAFKVICAVNHDKLAIKSHWANHPDVIHFEEDIRHVNLRKLLEVVRGFQAQYPDAYLILWGSMECTNYSKAKGGLPRDPDSRTLPNSLFRYIKVLDPDYIMVENVVEFMSWGPMRIKAKKRHKTFTDLCLITNKKTGQLEYGWEPISKRNGEDWLHWKERIDSLGYYNSWQELNSADFGAYTSRNRLFGIFARPGLPIAWPEPTHAKNPNASYGFLSPLNKWKAVKDVLDFSDEGHSILNRPFNMQLRPQERKDLVEPSLERIYAGLLKFVAGMNEKSFLAKYYSGKPQGKVTSINSPASVIPTAGNQSLVNVNFLVKYNSRNQKTGKTCPPSLDLPAPVISTQGRMGMAKVNFLTLHYSSGGNLASVEAPLATISTKDRFTSVTVQHFIDQQYGNGGNVDLNSPAGVITKNDKHALIPIYFLKRDFTEGTSAFSVDQPAGSLLTTPKINLMRVDRWILDTNYRNTGTSVDGTMGTILANRKHHYLMNPQYADNGRSLDEPCFTLIARMDKKPPSIVTPLFIETEDHQLGIIIYDTDSPMTRKIKEFMAIYGIVDIKMRMLKVIELKKIQGFPDNYQLMGSKADQKKFIGNSVVPLVVQKWGEALAEKLNQHFTNQKVA